MALGEGRRWWWQCLEDKLSSASESWRRATAISLLPVASIARGRHSFLLWRARLRHGASTRGSHLLLTVLDKLWGVVIVCVVAHLHRFEFTLKVLSWRLHWGRVLTRMLPLVYQSRCVESGGWPWSRLPEFRRVWRPISAPNSPRVQHRNTKTQEDQHEITQLIKACTILM